MDRKYFHLGFIKAGLIFKLIPVFFVILSVFHTGIGISWANTATEYLCELGTTYYSMGRYDEALSEFSKVLMIEPNNRIARKYVNAIFISDNPSVAAPASTRQAPQPQEQKTVISQADYEREMAINKAFMQLGADEKKYTEESGKNKDGIDLGGVRLTGEGQVRMGFAANGDAEWKRANWDMNEYNWRRLSNNGLNRNFNTYDPRIYDRLKLNLDTGGDTGLDFHGNITVDPWSFTGVSSNQAITSSGGDTANVILKYWSNTGYTINQNIRSTTLGNSFNLPEEKLYDGIIKGSTVSGNFTPADTFTIPEMKIYRQFQPVREFWVDYKQDNLKLRLYPIAYENQALTFDDPLKLSNNRIWWEDSPWLRGWTTGNLNTGLTPQDYNPGLWDNSLSYSTRDSEGQRLTALRGFSFDFRPLENTFFTTSVASPKNLWQDYGTADNFISATRLKSNLADRMSLGITATTRFGYIPGQDYKQDARNYVGGVDFSFEPVSGIQANLEYAHSESRYDMSSSQFDYGENGNAYLISLVGRFPAETITGTENGYDGILPKEEEGAFTKFKLFAARMDDSFDQPLSSYVETRDDEWWGRHLHFRKPFRNYFEGEGEMLTFDDIKNFRIGNGIDIGRNVLGFRMESLIFDKSLSNLLDVRNVHATTNKFVENVFRDELTWQATDKFTAKFLSIYQALPHTVGGVDPYIFNPETRRYYDNSSIEDGKDPSVGTASLGGEYQFADWISFNGIWEYTNDLSLGYDNYPRRLLNGSNNGYTFYRNGSKYRETLNYLYSQGYFPKPPYYYINVFKAGLNVKPADNLEFYLDYTRNPFEKAGQIDDNMNHVGLEMTYTPFKKLSMFFKYTYSRWQDVDKLISGINKVTGHNNFFAEFSYRQSEDQDLTFQYGEASRDPYGGGILDIGWDPYGGALETIDTQHIFRLYYRKKF